LAWTPQKKGTNLEERTKKKGKPPWQIRKVYKKKGPTNTSNFPDFRVRTGGRGKPKNTTRKKSWKVALSTKVPGRITFFRKKSNHTTGKEQKKGGPTCGAFPGEIEKRHTFKKTLRKQKASQKEKGKMFQKPRQITQKGSTFRDPDIQKKRPIKLAFGVPIFTVVGGGTKKKKKTSAKGRFPPKKVP